MTYKTKIFCHKAKICHKSQLGAQSKVGLTDRQTDRSNMTVTLSVASNSDQETPERVKETKLQ